jgi:hypothetical protein
MSAMGELLTRTRADIHDGQASASRERR